jgi:tetratricopeptide (TPR) repeat protein
VGALGERAGARPCHPQLIRVRDDNHLWTKIYDEELSSVFDVQTRIAENVTGALSVALAGDELHHMGARPTENLDAWDRYMRGERLLAREGSNAASAARAIALLTDATNADPRFALAFAKLSLGHLLQYEHYYDRSDARLRRGRVAAESAFALDPTLPDAHVALGRYYEIAGEFDRASAEYAIAERGRPNDFDILAATAGLLMRRGQWEEGVKRVARAARLNPRSPEANFAAAEALALTHDYSAAAEYAHRGLAADANIIGGHVLTALIHLMRTGDRVQARKSTQAIVLRFGAEQSAAAGGFDALVGTLDTTDLATLARIPISGFGGNAVAYYYWRTLLFEFWRPASAHAAADSLVRAARTLIVERPNDPGVHAARGWLYAVKGQPDSAARAARRALELAPAAEDAFAWSNAAHMAAGTFVRIGDYDTAIDQLEQLLKGPSWISIAVLRTDPLWARMRGHPRYERLIAGR